MSNSILLGQPNTAQVISDTVETTQEVSFFPNVEFINDIANSTKVEVYHLALDEKGKTIKVDTSTNQLMGFQVNKHLSHLFPADARQIKSIVSKAENYLPSDFLPKCGWYPDLAFKFTFEQQTITALVMSIPECNIAKFYWPDGRSIVREIYPARTELVAFAKSIFPREYFGVPAILDTSVVQRQQETPKAKEETPKVITEPLYKIYKVKRGDKWFKVAKKHKIKTNDLRKLNKSIKKLKPGMEIKIKKLNKNR